MSLWGGRFKETPHPLMKKLTYSIEIDKKLYKYDIQGSIAHVKMLAKCQIISPEEEKRITRSLKKILKDIEEGKLDFCHQEDIHMAIEEELIKREGQAGEKLHTARSRNDQIALDERLYLREEIKNIYDLICKFQATILKIAEENKEVIIPGYTHLQYAQPISFAHHLLAYFWMFERDKERLRDCYRRTNVCPLGVAALAGTSLPVDRVYVATILGFPSVTENSIDTVSDRDYIIEFLSFASILMMHLSRLSEDIVLWASPAFGFIEIADSFATGSSLMPQKKNPDVAELVRGKTGKVYGALISLLTIMKALPLSYNRDMQEDKIPLFQTVDEVKLCLEVYDAMFRSLKFNSSKMQQVAGEDFFAATDLTEYLVRKGIPFRKAHQIVGKMVRYCVEKNKTFNQLKLNEYKNFSSLFEEDVKDVVKVDSCVKNKNSPGGTGEKSLKLQIIKAREKLEKKNELFLLQER